MNDRSRILRPSRVFASIQWRLTATYVAITIFAILAVELGVAFDWLPSSPLLLVGTDFGKAGRLPLALGCWLADITMGAIGCVLTWRLLRR